MKWIRLLARYSAGILLCCFVMACSNSERETVVEWAKENGWIPDTLSSFPPSGFYSRDFVVRLPEADSVRCEMNGLRPSSRSALVTEMEVSSTSTIWCLGKPTESSAETEVVRTYVFEDAPTIPAVFLTANPNSLFDPDTGIYVDGEKNEDAGDHWQNYWQDKEIPVFVELMELGAKAPAFAEKAGLKIFGGSSRSNPKKSVAISFREKYGAKRLRYPLFPEYPHLSKFNNFILRNNGNNFSRDYIRDRLASSLSEGLDVDYQRGRFVVVYYNGEYFGIHDLREKTNEHFVETHHAIEPENVDLVTYSNKASAGSAADYVALLDWLESNHLSDEAKYDYVSSQIDIDNYINYMQTEIFADNRDWPGNNVKKWRRANPKSKWKWILYDMDFGFNNKMSSFTNNFFEFATAEGDQDWPNGPRHTLLFRRLLENRGFRIAFINRMATLLRMNFEKSRVLARIESLMEEIEQEIPRDQERWNHKVSSMERQLDVIKKFARNRQDQLFEEMREFFSLGEPSDVTLSVKGRGAIAVHGLKLDVPTLKVSFFKDVPVTVSAEGISGGIFTGWSDGVMDATRTILPGEIDALTANFR